MSSFNGFDTLPASASDAVKPWKVSIPQQSLDDLKTLLKLSPLAPPTYENSLPGGSDRRLGVRRDWLSQAKSYWERDEDDGGFSWRKHEDHINSFPHFKASVQDASHGEFSIHFVGLFSRRKDAVPIMVLHGWPGSFLEFLPILDDLRSKYTADDLPYHVIAPTLPGYTFSSPPPLDRDFNTDDAARIFDTLASSLLGFTSYMVQGGDVGGRIARIVAAKYPRCKAIHLNTGPMPPPDPSQLKSPIDAAEAQGIERSAQFRETGSAYAMEHATRPATIGFALSSSPLALLAWIGEKFLDWTDADPPLDTILESVTLYWLTHSAATSLWSYRQFYGPTAESHATPRWHVAKPLGFSWFPKELTPVPKAWVELTGNLVFYRQHDRGGHFAALELPRLLWADVEEFLDGVKGLF